MSDLAKKIDQATARLLAAAAERDAALADRNRHEQQAKAIRKLSDEARQRANTEAFEQEELSRKADTLYESLKAECNQLEAVLRHTQVQKSVEDSAAAAFKAQKDAEASRAEQEAITARLAEKESKLDELIAKATQPQA